MSPEDAWGERSVSRETSDLLAAFAALVRKWNQRINLVAPGTIEGLEARHIEDSLDLLSIAPKSSRWVDLGSGGGFPGLVIAIALRDETRIAMIESDQRKCEFLRAVRRELGLDFDVIPSRIETAEPQGADIVSARALAPLRSLLGLAHRHGSRSATYLFPKGRNWRAEVGDIGSEWQYDMHAAETPDMDGSAILKITNLRRVHET